MKPDSAPLWTPAFPAQSVEPDSMRVFKHSGHQVVVVRTAQGTLYAVDNRCPHEGYPLAQGSVSGCVLTCNWHNYKFDLRDGSCVLGEEAVRSFPVRERAGQIEVELSPPDTAEECARLWRSMDQGMHEHRLGRVARDVVRLIQAGTPPADIAAYGARWDALRAEYGPGHATAVAADVCTYLDRYTGPQAALPLVQALDIASFSSRRMPPRIRPEPVEPGTDPELAGVRFFAMVEAEDGPGAEGLMRGALAAGWGPDTVLPWMFQVTGAHFLDFGHQLIYLCKAVDLLEQVGWSQADPILSSLCHSIVNGTREDLLPDWSSLRQHLGALEPELAELYTGCTEQADPSWTGGPQLSTALLEGRRSEVFERLTDALRARAPLEAIIDVLSIGAAQRMLRFDVDHDPNVEVQDNWLSVTHTQTFAAAIRRAARTVSDPAILRMLFHAARFIHASRVLDSAPERCLSTEPTSHRGVEQVMDAISAGQAQSAIGQVASWIRSGQDLQPLELALLDRVISDSLTRPIVVAHAIKTTVVGIAEYRATGSPLPLLGLIHLLSSRIQERRVHRVTREAIAFVTQGKVPRRLA